jgi:hypothetical protein
MELSSVKPAENLSLLGKKPADSWALDKSVRMVYYHRLGVTVLRVLEMYSKVHWGNEGVPLYYVFV